MNMGAEVSSGGNGGDGVQSKSDEREKYKIVNKIGRKCARCFFLFFFYFSSSFLAGGLFIAENLFRAALDVRLTDTLP